VTSEKLTMRKLATILAVLLASTIVCRAADEPLDALMRRAEQATGGEQVKLYAEVARRQLHAAGDLFTAGDVQKARRAVDEVVTYSEKAGAAARISGKRLKETEIAVRKISKKLTDINRTLNVEDRPPVQAAIDKLEDIRSQLLAHMFRKKAKGAS
jgi:hypothetical protein